MKSKYKQCNKDLKSLSNISNAFSFDTQFDFHTNNYNNYKSIFSYKTIESNDEDENIKENNYYPITLIMGFLMILLFPISGWFSFKVVRRNYKLAVFRYGKLLKIINPGIALVIPLIDSCKYIDTAVKVTGITAASCPTKDHGLVEMDCSVKYRIIDPRYLIINVKNWSEFLLTETRVALLLCMKHFRWSDFSDVRIKCDVEDQIKKLLISNVDAKGLEICEVNVANMIQGKEPETPMDVLKKINFKDLGRQLSSMTPLFLNSTNNASGNSVGNNDDSSKEKAVVNFFEKLELIKNIAIKNMAQQKEPEKPIMIAKSIKTDEALVLEQLVKSFIRHNISTIEITKILSQQSIKPLFENVPKVIELSRCIKDIMTRYNINGNILFDVTNYFKYSCHFHYSYEKEMLVDGNNEDNVIVITL